MPEPLASSPPGAQSGPKLLVLVGNPRPGSRTLRLGVALAGAVRELLGAGSVTSIDSIDLAELTEQVGPPLGAGSFDRYADPLRRLHEADLVIVTTPTYKGSYTGLLKSFLDHVGGGALAGVTAIPVTSVGGPAHTLAADVHLRPLLIELGTSTPTAALVVGNDQLDDPAEAIAGWIAVNGPILLRALASPAPLRA